MVTIPHLYKGHTKLLSDLPSTYFHVYGAFFSFNIFYVLAQGLKFSCSVLV